MMCLLLVGAQLCAPLAMAQQPMPPTDPAVHDADNKVEPQGILGLGEDDDVVADFFDPDGESTPEAWTANPFLGLLSSLVHMALTLHDPVSEMGFGGTVALVTKTFFLKNRLKERAKGKEALTDLGAVE